MTKSQFITLWSGLENVATKKINGEFQWSCSCGLISHSGGYTLEIYPQCIMWSDEVCGLVGLSALSNLRIVFSIKQGYIYIY